MGEGQKRRRREGTFSAILKKKRGEREQREGRGGKIRGERGGGKSQVRLGSFISRLQRTKPKVPP